MNLPRVGAPHMDNLIATLLVSGNGSHLVNLNVIAKFQGFRPEEFRARFYELETIWSRQPHNSEEIPDGK